jgi:hypothetical protein
MSNMEHASILIPEQSTINNQPADCPWNGTHLVWMLRFKCSM